MITQPNTTADKGGVDTATQLLIAANSAALPAVFLWSIGKVSDPIGIASVLALGLPAIVLGVAGVIAKPKGLSWIWVGTLGLIFLVWLGWFAMSMM